MRVAEGNFVFYRYVPYFLHLRRFFVAVAGQIEIIVAKRYLTA